MQLRSDVDASWFAEILEGMIEDEPHFEDTTNDEKFTPRVVRDGRWVHVFLDNENGECASSFLITVIGQ